MKCGPEIVAISRKENICSAFNTSGRKVVFIWHQKLFVLQLWFMVGFVAVELPFAVFSTLNLRIRPTNLR